MSMRLLVCAQAVDERNLTLGFFVSWLREFARRFDSLEVVALGVGPHSLPGNVRVHSLGKEKKRAGKIVYAIRFLSLVWRTRREYDAVFVHMNQEYVLLAGWLWRLLGKRVYLWRNHYDGSAFTDIAALFCDKVFCTSRSSYTAKYKKTVLMPVGVDASAFAPVPGVSRVPRSILFLARIAPSKRAEMLTGALALLARRGVEFEASTYGSPLVADLPYYERLKRDVREGGLQGAVKFEAGVPNAQTPQIYSSHEVFVNTSPSGMYDKTLFEAAACGCIVVASSRDFCALSGQEPFDDAEGLARELARVLALPADGRRAESGRFRTLAESHSLAHLGERLSETLRS